MSECESLPYDGRAPQGLVPELVPALILELLGQTQDIHNPVLG